MPAETEPQQEITIKIGNEINARQTFFAGSLLVLFTFLPILIIIGIWPNKLPPIDKESALIYKFEWFNVTLKDSVAKVPPGAPVGVKVDKKSPGQVKDRVSPNMEINLNSLIFILVASAGFLGSMIHIASSFADYVGSNQFRKSWLLWYVVKPIAGAAIALIMYFIVRAGILNVGDSNSVNLFGVITIGALSGLFADKATLKLEEVFAVMFKPNDKRSDKLEPDKVNVTLIKIKDVAPEELSAHQINDVVINGEGFDTQKIVLKVNAVEVSDAIKDSTSFKFSYSVPDGLEEGKGITLQLFDEKGIEIYKKDFTVKKTDGVPEEAGDSDSVDDEELVPNESDELVKG